MTTVLDIVENWDEIPKDVRYHVGTDRLQDEVQRALNVGAEPPLEWVGSGMTGSVFCDAQSLAYKVAHYQDDHSRGTFQREFEWLEEAFSIGLPVSEPVELDLDELVIVRTCPVGRPGGWADTKRLQELHYEEMAPAMEKAGWKMPEFKTDSYIIGDDGSATLVDASFPIRIGIGMLKYARDVASGKRDPYQGSPSDVAMDLQTEILMERVDEKVAKPIVKRLFRLERG
jgi:hypothetical protein